MLISHITKGKLLKSEININTINKIPDSGPFEFYLFYHLCLFLGARFSNALFLLWSLWSVNSPSRFPHFSPSHF